MRAFANMRGGRLFLQARAVMKLALLATKTSEIPHGEQRALRKFSSRRNILVLLRGNVIVYAD